MKKLLCVLLSLTMLMGMGASAVAAETLDIGLCATDTTNPFIGWLTGSVKEQGEAEGLNVQIADAGGSAMRQLSRWKISLPWA